MTGWYLYEIAITGVMDVLMACLFGIIFYFLMKWYIILVKEEILKEIKDLHNSVLTLHDMLDE